MNDTVTLMEPRDPDLCDPEDREAASRDLVDRLRALSPLDALFADTLEAWAAKEQLAGTHEYVAKRARLRAMALSSGKNSEAREAEAMSDPHVHFLDGEAKCARIDADVAYHELLHLRGRQPKEVLP